MHARIAADELRVGLFLRSILTGGSAAVKPKCGSKPKQSRAQQNGQKQKSKATKQASKQAQRPSKAPEFSAQAPVLFDIGANLLDRMFQGEYNGSSYHDPDLDAVLARASAARVGGILCTAGNLAESLEAVKLVHELRKLPPTSSGKSPINLFSTVGVHPTRCSEIAEFPDGPDQYLLRLHEAASIGAKNGTVIAIGECGLDYDRLQFCPAAVQRQYFEAQLDLAHETGLPLFLHMRAAATDFCEIVQRNRHKFKHGVAHSFTGTVDEMKTLVELGLHIGINGCSLRTPEALDCVRQIPKDRLLLETDAPWCGIRKSHAGYRHIESHWPTMNRKKYCRTACVDSRSEPCHMRQVLEVVAAARGEPIDQLASLVETNTRTVFPRLVTGTVAKERSKN